MTKENILKGAGALVLAGALILGARQIFFPNQAVGEEVTRLAQCLGEKQVTMYGAAWCPHCQNEKRLFGESFKYVPYVECPADPKRCQTMDINGYPTWVLPDGTKLVGEQGLEKISIASGCAYHPAPAPSNGSAPQNAGGNE